jgi:hypothetical protein
MTEMTGPVAAGPKSREPDLYIESLMVLLESSCEAIHYGD